MKPASVDSGFILSLPKIQNPSTSDLPYQRILAWYLPPKLLDDLRSRLEKFGDEAISDRIDGWVSNAEQEQPYLRSRNVWGERYSYDRLVTSEGWKQLGRWGISNGLATASSIAILSLSLIIIARVVSLGYENEFGPYRRIAQHAFNYIYSASSAVYSCPVSMTSGAARLILHQLPGLPPDHPFHEVYRRIISREGNWISSQWMTERPGGSDVQNSETVAVFSPLSASEKSDTMNFNDGDWLISGYKFFCSATDCDIALMLAKTESGQLSLFIAPTKRTVKHSTGKTELVTNGIRIHRLKNKMGTKELPTAEVELRDVRAWMVGPIDRGIATIATLLNVSRTHNAVTALSCWRRGMAIAKGFAQARTTIDQPLWTFPMHLRLLASMEVKFQGLLHLAFFTTSLLSFVDNGFPAEQPSNYPPLPEPGEQTKVVQRTLTAMAKGVICKVACIALQECQEAMGGVGYMDEPDEPEFNISRLYRDTAANMTWEGTTNVLSSEVVRHLLSGKALDMFSSWFEQRVLATIRDESLKDTLENSWLTLKGKLSASYNDLAVVLSDGRQVMFTLAWIISGSLLAHDAQRDSSETVATEVAHRWILEGDGGVGEFVFHDVVFAKRRPENVKERINRDCRLVWGVDLPDNSATGYRAPATTSRNEPEKLLARL